MIVYKETLRIKEKLKETCVHETKKNLLVEYLLKNHLQKDEDLAIGSTLKMQFSIVARSEVDHFLSQ